MISMVFGQTEYRVDYSDQKGHDMKCETAFHNMYLSGACSDVATHLVNLRISGVIAVCAGCKPFFQRHSDNHPNDTVIEIVSVD